MIFDQANGVKLLSVYHLIIEQVTIRGAVFLTNISVTEIACPNG